MTAAFGTSHGMAWKMQSRKRSDPAERDMRLSILAKEIGAPVRGGGDPEIRDVRLDSRQVEPDDLFVAISGAAADGARFVRDAIDRGARAVVWSGDEPLAVPTLRVPDPRAVVGRLADAVHGRPTERIPVVGITGTNGKTTTSFLVEAAVRSAWGSAARIGTLGTLIGGVEEEGAHTTPEADTVHRLAARALAAGDRALVMEVSSHALAFGRVGGVRLRVAAFTNLTQDHLDFHRDMDDYFEAKRRLFTEHSPAHAVVSIDDAWGRKLAAELRGVRTVSTDLASTADFRPFDVAFDRDGLRGRVRTPSGEIAIASPLVGRHNLQNVLVALATADALGIDLAVAARGIGSVACVPGRLEPAKAPPDVRVFVDYSHTPDALARALEALRPLTPGRLLCVFGCGGDRDRTKRAPMGEAAARGADIAIATTDNPRTEDPLAILGDIRPGLVEPGRPEVPAQRLGGAHDGVHVEADRRAAIALAVSVAQPGDVVLLAGKGHETYQIVGTTKHPFDDRVEAAAVTDALASPSGDMPDRWAGTAGGVATDVDGTLEGSGPSLPIRGVSTDTRSLCPGAVFFALSGPSFDGHAFLEAARDRGARLAVVRMGATAPDRMPVVRVDDPLLALGRLAAAHLRRWRAGGRKVVAVTGSAGKTTTKELTAAALGPRTLRTVGNLNNLIGLPLTALRLDSRAHDRAVLEMGTSAPGEIARLAAIAPPDVAIVTNASAAHTEGLGTVDDVAREKASLWAGMAPGGIAVVNADDARLLALAPAPSWRFTFGRTRAADVWIAVHRPGPRGGDLGLDTPAGTAFVRPFRLLGAGAAEDAAAAAAAARLCEVSPEDIAARLSEVAPLPRRLEPRAAGDVTILDDSYNANPRSMAMAIETLAAIAPPEHRVAVLGDMLELGAGEEAAHVAVLQVAKRCAVRDAVLVGPRMARAASAFPGAQLAADFGQAVDVVRRALRPGDVVLVKASHGIRLDRVADALVAEREAGAG